MSRRFEIVSVPMLADGPEHDADRDAILELDAVCLPRDTAPPISWGDWDPEAPRAWWLIRENRSARLGPRFVGYAGCYVNPRQRWIYLCRAGILPAARGHGLQRKLIRARTAWARGLGAAVVTDTTDNVASANNLIACGFRLWAPPYKWAFEHSCYWRRELPGAAA